MYWPTHGLKIIYKQYKNRFAFRLQISTNNQREPISFETKTIIECFTVAREASNAKWRFLVNKYAKLISIGTVLLPLSERMGIIGCQCRFSPSFPFMDCIRVRYSMSCQSNMLSLLSTSRRKMFRRGPGTLLLSDRSCSTLFSSVIHCCFGDTPRAGKHDRLLVGDIGRL